MASATEVWSLSQDDDDPTGREREMGKPGGLSRAGESAVRLG